MGDLNKRRGRVLGMNPAGAGKTEVVADVPMMELFGYSTDLRSMTGGSGTYSYEFARYEQTPSDVQEKKLQQEQPRCKIALNSYKEGDCEESQSPFAAVREESSVDSQ